MKAKKPSRLGRAIAEMATDQRQVGVISDAACRKITLRHLGTEPLSVARPITGREIRNMREKANLSQAAFARYMNLTVGYISQLERGVTEPKGPVLTLLNVIQRKGLDAIL